MRTRLILTALAAGLCTATASAQRPARLERIVQPITLPFDKDDTWTLTFVYKKPRVVTVDIPGRGKRRVWYMWYQVINDPKFTGNKPVHFEPEIELFTVDYYTNHTDQVLPTAQARVLRIEDPRGVQDIKNSVEIARKMIQPTKPDELPRAYTGVAIWPDVYEKAPKTSTFVVFVKGLSNGWSKREGDATVRRKVLQLNFKRRSDGRPGRRDPSGDIDYNEDAPPKWYYRSVSLPPEGK